MREAELYSQLESARKRIAMIYRQMAFIDTRMQAFEQILFISRWNILKFLISPSKLFQSVDALHLKLMQEHDANMARLAEEAKKPKIQIVPAGAMNGR